MARRRHRGVRPIDRGDGRMGVLLSASLVAHLVAAAGDDLLSTGSRVGVVDHEHHPAVVLRLFLVHLAVDDEPAGVLTVAHRPDPLGGQSLVDQVGLHRVGTLLAQTAGCTHGNRSGP